MLLWLLYLWSSIQFQLSLAFAQFVFFSKAKHHSLIAHSYADHLQFKVC